jgi:UDP-GlcNAc:undecaprenyl-phosphate GlcNAc-1-phosphate transferase
MHLTVGPLLLGVAAFAVATLLVPLTSRLAYRYGAVVHPRADRWSHQVVPILGGLAVASAVGAVAWVVVDKGATFFAWLFGLVGLTVIGLMDDLYGVRPRYRVLAEALLGAGFMFVVFDDQAMPLRLAWGLAGALAIPVMTNATNLVDNADGLASSLSAETAATIALSAMAAGMKGNQVGLGLVICGACLGFLVHNRPPARVFMGDAGSLMLGFALAACGALLIHDAVLHPGPQATAAVLAMPLAAFVQFGDVAMVSVTRMRRGESPFKGGVDHTSHRLVRAGLQPIEMLVVVGFVSLSCGSLAVLLSWLAPHPALELAVVALAGLIVLGLETLIALRVPHDVPAPSAAPESATTAPAAPAPPVTPAPATGRAAARRVAAASGSERAARRP